MKISEIVEIEEKNQNCIILHGEGIFWRAYERSAYAFATQVAPMQILKKPLKVLQGREVCYLGFPMANASAYLRDLMLVEETEKLRKYQAPRPWKETDYQLWHDSVPVRAASGKSQERYSQEGAGIHAEVLALLRDFDISTSSPLDAFNLLVTIKQKLKV